MNDKNMKPNVSKIDAGSRKREGGTAGVNRNQGNQSHHLRGLRVCTPGVISPLANKADIPQPVLMEEDGIRIWLVECPVCGKLTKLPHKLLLSRKGKLERLSCGKQKIHYQSLFVCTEDSSKLGGEKQTLGSKAYRYSEATNKNLCEILQTHYDNKSIDFFSDLLTVDAPLYHELSKRGCWKAVAKKNGNMVREVIDYESKTDRWWKSQSRKYDSIAHWKRESSHAVKMAYQLNKMDMLRKYNIDKWAKRVGLDGCLYDSIPEMTFANILFISKIEYIAHKILPFKRNRGRMITDFYLPQYDIYIEVFMHSNKSIARYKKDHFAREYVENREIKEANYKVFKLRLAAVEASIYKMGYLEIFLAHVKAVLKEIGINIDLNKLRNVNLDRSIGCEYTKMSAKHIANFIVNELKGDGLTALHKYHQPMAQYVRKKNNGKFITDVAIELAKLNGKPISTRRYKASDEEIIAFIRDNKLTQGQYTKMYKKNELPAGFPARPIGISFPKARGEARLKRPETYADAKELISQVCRNYGVQFRSEKEYLVAREEYPELRCLPKQPDNPTAYGISFINWPDYLGIPGGYKYDPLYSDFLNNGHKWKAPRVKDFLQRFEWRNVAESPVKVREAISTRYEWALAALEIGVIKRAPSALMFDSRRTLDALIRHRCFTKDVFLAKRHKVPELKFIHTHDERITGWKRMITIWDAAREKTEKGLRRVDTKIVETELRSRPKHRAAVESGRANC